MRQVRDDLSTLLQTDTERFYKELKQTMADFISRRKQAIHKHNVAQDTTKKE